MMAGSSKEFARHARNVSDRMAQETRAMRRGTCSGFDDATGRAVVELPNGGKVLVPQSRLFPVATNQAVDLVLNGRQLAILAPSPYGGGLGGLFVPP